MRDIEATKKWLANYCRYYNMRGLPDECNAGVNYSELADGSRPGMMLRLPCLRDHETDVVCEKREFLSDEEITAQADIIVRSRDVMLKCIPAAKEDAAKHGFRAGNGGSGEIACPACGSGTLHYTVAGANGHMHASCTTDGCASWME